ncbi:MAG TPA: MOSC domain-containing protein [Nitrososphaerales archaeon]|nr:MOSC domain-containing protein [Nitrososphaerales archaeon]
MAKLVSVNVGLPVEIGSARGKRVFSGIVKKPVIRPVIVRKLNLDGDRQADLSVHGGVDKAVYVYPSENYPFWKNEFPSLELPWGSFGENFTTKGLQEDFVRIGDRLHVGSAEFAITQPRFPCYKLAIRFGTNKMINLFLESLRSGFYLRVLKEGKVRAGEEIRVIRGSDDSESVGSIVRTFLENEKAAPRIERKIARRDSSLSDSDQFSSCKK